MCQIIASSPLAQYTHTGQGFFLNFCGIFVPLIRSACSFRSDLTQAFEITDFGYRTPGVKGRLGLDTLIVDVHFNFGQGYGVVLSSSYRMLSSHRQVSKWCGHFLFS
jgi:hypothetical protein